MDRNEMRSCGGARQGEWVTEVKFLNAGLDGNP